MSCRLWCDSHSNFCFWKDFVCKWVEIFEIAVVALRKRYYGRFQQGQVIQAFQNWQQVFSKSVQNIANLLKVSSKVIYYQDSLVWETFPISTYIEILVALSPLSQLVML